MIMIPLQYAEAHVAKGHTNTKAAVPHKELLPLLFIIFPTYNINDE